MPGGRFLKYWYRRTLLSRIKTRYCILSCFVVVCFFIRLFVCFFESLPSVFPCCGTGQVMLQRLLEEKSKICQSSRTIDQLLIKKYTVCLCLQSVYKHA